MRLTHSWPNCRTNGSGFKVVGYRGAVAAILAIAPTATDHAGGDEFTLLRACCWITPESTDWPMREMVWKFISLPANYTSMNERVVRIESLGCNCALL
jgi:hypothetical protein